MLCLIPFQYGLTHYEYPHHAGILFCLASWARLTIWTRWCRCIDMEDSFIFIAASFFFSNLALQPKSIVLRSTPFCGHISSPLIHGRPVKEIEVGFSWKGSKSGRKQWRYSCVHDSECEVVHEGCPVPADSEITLSASINSYGLPWIFQPPPCSDLSHLCMYSSVSDVWHPFSTSLCVFPLYNQCSLCSLFLFNYHQWLRFYRHAFSGVVNKFFQKNVYGHQLTSIHPWLSGNSAYLFVTFYLMYRHYGLNLPLSGMAYQL